MLKHIKAMCVNNSTILMMEFQLFFIIKLKELSELYFVGLYVVGVGVEIVVGSLFSPFVHLQGKMNSFCYKNHDFHYYLNQHLMYVYRLFITLSFLYYNNCTKATAVNYSKASSFTSLLL